MVELEGGMLLEGSKNNKEREKKERERRRDGEIKERTIQYNTKIRRSGDGLT